GGKHVGAALAARRSRSSARNVGLARLAGSGNIRTDDDSSRSRRWLCGPGRLLRTLGFYTRCLALRFDARIHIENLPAGQDNDRKSDRDEEIAVVIHDDS